MGHTGSSTASDLGFGFTEENGFPAKPGNEFALESFAGGTFPNNHADFLDLGFSPIYLTPSVITSMPEKSALER